MKHRVGASCVWKLDCYHFSWRRSHNWVLCSLFFSFNWMNRLMDLLFFIWTLRMIDINSSVNPCHLRCPIVCWKVSINFPCIFITFFSRLCNFRKIILSKSTFNRTFSIFKCNRNSIATVIIWLLLFFVRIILRFELYIGWCRNIRALILILLYLYWFFIYLFFILVVFLSHHYTRGNTLPSLLILWLIWLLRRACILWMRDIDWLHWSLAILTMMDPFTDSGLSWLRIELIILIHYTSLTFINTTHITVMWTSNQFSRIHLSIEFCFFQCLYLFIEVFNLPYHLIFLHYHLQLNFGPFFPHSLYLLLHIVLRLV